MEGCIFLHKTLPEGLLLPGDQYIPDPAILIYPSGNACGSPQGRLPAALLPGHGLQLTDKPEYFRYHQIRSEYHTHLSECRKPQFLQVRYPEYVHLIS